MCSMRLVCARPVRIFFSCSLNAATHFCMRTVASFFTSSSMYPPQILRIGRYHGADIFALDDTHQITVVEQIEDRQRQIVFPALDDRGGIHHIEAVVEHLVEGQARIALDL